MSYTTSLPCSFHHPFTVVNWITVNLVGEWTKDSIPVLVFLSVFHSRSMVKLFDCPITQIEKKEVEVKSSLFIDLCFMVPLPTFLGVTGLITSTPSAALDCCLNISSLNLFIKIVAMKSAYCLQCEELWEVYTGLFRILQNNINDHVRLHIRNYLWPYEGTIFLFITIYKL